MRDILMNYLKIYLRYFLFVISVFILSCVSDSNIVISEESSTKNQEEIQFDVLKDENSEIYEQTPLVNSIVRISPNNSIQDPHLYLPEPPILERAEREVNSISLDFYNVRIREDEKEPGYFPDKFQESLTVRVEEVIPVSETVVKKEVLQKSEIQVQRVVNIDHSVENSTEEINIVERYMSIQVLKNLDVILSGKRWIYLPGEKDENIEYVGRKFNNDNTIYTFIPKLEGSYVLSFQYQDLLNNNHIIEKINISVLGIISETEIDKRIKIEENSESEEIFDLESVLLAYILEDNSKEISNLVPDLLKSNDANVLEHMGKTGEILYNASYFVESASIFNILINNPENLSSSDRWLFLLGKIYEENSSIRNEQTAAKYYKLIVDNYPASIYWNESQNRYRFLKRRYIDIR
jgi:hypothetical protein